MSTIQIESTTHEPGTLFFREAWANGTGDDGSKFDLTRTVGGGSLVLHHTDSEGTETIESIPIKDLVIAWIKGIENNEKENS